MRGKCELFVNITTIQSHVTSGTVFGGCLHTQEYLPEVIGRSNDNEQKESFAEALLRISVLNSR